MADVRTTSLIEMLGAAVVLFLPAGHLCDGQTGLVLREAPCTTKPSSKVPFQAVLHHLVAA